MPMDKPAGTCECGEPLRWVTSRRPWRLSHVWVNHHQPRLVQPEPATAGAR